MTNTFERACGPGRSIQNPRPLTRRGWRACALGLLLGLGLGSNALAADPAISIGNGSIAEGNSGTTTLNLPVTRSGDLGGNIGLEFRTDESPSNPATAGTDYVAVTAGAAVLPAGAGSVNLPVAVNGDTAVEPDEQFLVHLLSATNAGPTPDFGGATNLSAGSRPRSVAVADLDGDGRLDLAIANGSSNNVSVRLNTTAPGDANASYADAVNFPAGSFPFSVAVGDINGDGRPDLAVANQDSNNVVSVLLNTTVPGQPLSYAGPASFGAGNLPSSIAVGDLNGDGRPDLAATNFFGNNVSVLLNTAAPGAPLGYAAAANFAAGTGPNAIAIGDLNGDGRPDLAVANRGIEGGSGGSVSVLLNTAAPGAAINYAAPANLSAGSSPRSVAVGDVNGDGRPDLAVANQDSNNVSVLLNSTLPGETLPSYAAAVNFATGAVPVSVALSDVNDDGRPDLAVANNAGANVSVLLNTTAPGAVSPRYATAANFAAGTGPFSVAVGDVNGDGRPDLALANSVSDNVSVLLNTTIVGVASANYAAAASFGASVGPRSIAVADFNGDGRPDLALANYRSASVSVLLNTAAPGAANPSYAAAANIPTGAGPQSVAVGDVNGDGRPDLTVANLDASYVSVLLNTTAAGDGAPTYAAAVNLTAGNRTSSVAVGDVNGDGRPDLAVANANSNNVSVLLNTAGPGDPLSYADAVHFAVGNAPIAVAIADVNGDGRPDLATANFSGNNVSVLLNMTDPGATAPVYAIASSFPVGFSPASVAIGDVNGDGRPDLATANANTSNVSVLLNSTAPGDASLGYAAAANFAVGNFPYSVAMGDVNGDGRADLAVAIAGNANVSVLLNTTAPGDISPSYTNAMNFPAGDNPRAVAMGDVNGDGRVDLAVANFASDDVSVLLNQLYSVSIGTNEGAGTILNDDRSLPTVAFTQSSRTVPESAGALSFTVRLSSASGQTVSVPFSASGSASAADYSGLTASPLSFAPGITEKTLALTITDDAIEEDDETLVLTLGTPTNAMLGSPAALSLTIQDNDSCKGLTPTQGCTVNGVANQLCVGTAGNDSIIVAGNGRSVVLGGDGNDTLMGGNGDDLLCGGRGNDTLRGNRGNDRLLGSVGGDSLFGDDGNDALDGGLGSDSADGGKGTDTCTAETRTGCEQ
ncbi:MAG: FG-GAP-like repeat-containing protein [Panacagrimonas sp.]